MATDDISGNYNIDDWVFPFDFQYKNKIYSVDWWQCADGENNSDYPMRLSIYLNGENIYSFAMDSVTIQDIIDGINEYLKGENK